MTLAAIDWLSTSITLLLILFVANCLLLSLLILMQRPKQEGLGAAFGSGMTDQLLGARTTSFLQKSTVYLGGLFFALAVVLAILISNQNENRASIVKEETAAEETAAEDAAGDEAGEESATSDEETPVADEEGTSLEEQLGGALEESEPAGTPADGESGAPVEDAAGDTTSEETGDEASEEPGDESAGDAAAEDESTDGETSGEPAQPER